ncbi:MULTISPECIES: hypothetical protein [unclassified Chelatococcus]|uniref:phage tail assembly chaperone n=1 Tax=unclassified Chelatococcus TaxID=2638111 RepID=UPI001BD132DB|nr:MULTISPECIES: hypothetical protein [unclassified Chelatococcus]CAH1670778.1 hypothetical protein CHELA41_23441 [Hyphomicrobiales bacterium]MBS7738380.1 hypothetical protein [Chelatococcus sp. HY11]MBX3547351.1 hypothetical protein [Chelatococcus sp.]MCO5077274.1 hypothetical protein [Chelatococcus sp.]CAH1676995.1 hypothetical protein CHELA20_51572 [Hyphomicrobiales bacterium]
MPEHLLAPELDPVEAEIVEAFNELASDRPVAFGIGPIPFSSIARYAAFCGFDTLGERDFLRRALRAMDAKFLELTAKPRGKT